MTEADTSENQGFRADTEVVPRSFNWFLSSPSFRLSMRAQSAKSLERGVTRSLVRLKAQTMRLDVSSSHRISENREGIQLEFTPSLGNVTHAKSGKAETSRNEFRKNGKNKQHAVMRVTAQMYDWASRK